MDDNAVNPLQMTQWSRLPPWVKAKVEELGVSNVEEWLQKKIPALGQKSVADLASSNEGEAALREYFAKVLS